MKFLPIVFFLSGFLPAPLSFISYGKTSVDAISLINGNKTTTDILMSNIIEKDCSIHHFFDDLDYCVEFEYLDE